MVTKETNRLLSLDVLRGVTISGMILVNTPGSWDAVYAPFCHASWNGLTPTDLVYPFFMFIMGVSIYISLQKYKFTFTWPVALKIVRRAFLIFLIGIGINWFTILFSALVDDGNTGMDLGQRLTDNIFPFERIRIPGVLQRLALCYLGGALIALWVKPQHYVKVIAGILVAYTAILFAGNCFTITNDSWIVRVDRAIFGESHLLWARSADGARVPFDPEALLSTLPCFAQVLIGMLVGRLIMVVKDNEKRIQQLFLYGTLLVFAAYLFSYGCPLNKRLWTPTFVLMTCGAGSLLLALLVYVIDLKGKKKWCVPFEAFGVNPLFMYVFSELLAIVLAYTSLQGLVYDNLLASWMDPYLASLVYALLFVLLNWWVAHILYVRKIYIKI